MYKVKLGIDFDKSELKNVESKINNLTDNTHRIRIDLDSTRIHKQFDHIEKRFKNLTGTKGNVKSAIPIDTSGLNKALSDVASTIKEIKASIGSLDSGNMKSLVSSINQIATSLGRATDESETLVSALNALSKKDFNISLGIDMGKKGLNSIGYGRAARKQVIPELESQIAELESLLGGQQATMKKLSSQGKNLGFDIFTDFSDFNSDSAIKKMEAMEKYVNTLRKLATMDNINLGDFDKVHKDASELINDITGLDNTVDKAGDVPQKLKNLFGGNVDGDALSTQLESIVGDLREIKTAFQGLSSGASLDGLTQSFNRLSETLEKLMTNAKLVQDVLGSNIAATGLSNQKKEAQETAKAFKETTTEAKKLDSVSIDISSGDIDELKAALRSMKVDDDSIEKATSELKEMGVVAKNVSATFKDGKLAKIEVKGVETTLDGLKRATTVTTTFGDKVASTSKKSSQALNEVAITAEKVNKKLASGGFGTEISKIEKDCSQLSNKSVDLENDIRALKNALNGMEAAGDIDELMSSYKEYEEILERIENQLKTNKNIEQQANRENSLQLDKERALQRLKGLFGENSQAARKFAAEINRIEKEIEECGSADGIRNLIKQINNLEASAKSANYKTHTFGQNLSKQWERYKSYFSIASVFMYTEQALRDMFQQVVAIDTAMTELKKVTDETTASYDKFLTNASERASEIGTTIDGLITSTADFARLGYDFADAANLAEVANIYTVVGDEIDSVDTATQSVISTMKAFKVEAADSMSIVDKFNEVSNNFAISSGGIGEALTRSASSLAAANNSLDESIALITASNTVVQDPTVVGTALKTISMRIRGAKTEMEEAGLETEGMAESTAKLQAELKALSGVDIMLDKDTFKSTYQIMEELANKWEDLTDIQQASVTELIAGKRQGNIVSSLMTNFDIAQDSLQTSLESEGSAMREHEKWMESLQAKINQLKAAWQGFSQAFMRSDFLKGALDTLIKILEVLTKMIDTVGTLPTIFAGFGLFKLGKRGLSSLFGASQNEVDVLIKMAEAMGLVGVNSGKSATLIGKADDALKGMVANAGGTGAALKGVGSSLLGLAKAHPIALAVTAGITLLAGAAIKAKKDAKELAEEVDKLTTDYQEQHTALVQGKGNFESLATSYSKLSRGVDGLGNNVSLTTDEYAEYQSVVNEIATQVPSLVAGYDSQGNAILNCASNVDALTAAYEKLIKAQNNEILSNSEDIQKDFNNVLKDANKHSPTNDKLTTDTKNALKEFLNNTYSAKEIEDYLEKDVENNVRIHEMVKAIQDAGIEVLDESGKAFDLGTFYTSSNANKYVAAAIEQNGEAIRSIIDGVESELDAEAEGMKSLAEATLSDAFDISDSKYADMSESLQNLARQIVSSFDGEFYAGLSEKDIEVEDYINDMLDVFNDLDTGTVKEIESVFDLQTKFNNGDVSYGEYVSGIQQVGKIIDGLALDDEVKSQIKLALNTEELVTEYNSLKNRLTSEEYNIELSASNAEKFLNGLTAEQFSVAMDVIPDIVMSDAEIENELNELGEGGSVDLTLRPTVDSSELLDAGWKEAGMGAATVFTSTFSNKAGDIAMNFTPIMADENGNHIGTLSPEELTEYAEGVIAGTREDDLNLQIGAKFEGEDAIEDAEAAAERIHDLHGVYFDVYPNIDISELESEINRAMIQQGLVFDLSIDVETESLESLNTALAESVSATGLSSESISFLKSRYSELESEGYNLSAMFEETTMGIRLNKTAFNELEQAYTQYNINENYNDIMLMKEEYDNLTKEINSCTDATERADLVNKRETLAGKISECATLAAQYEALTSAYNDWLNAEEAGNERDMYENVHSAMETVKDELDRGWIDTGTQEYFQLIWGEDNWSTAGKSVEDYRKKWKTLDDTISGTSYSIEDFFKVDDDGNLTSEGIFNFYDAVYEKQESLKKNGKFVDEEGKALSDWITLDDDGNIASFDFGFDGGKAIAEAMGISEELVQIFVQASRDAGFVVNFDGTYSQLADMENKAIDAANTLKEMGKTKYNFDFNTTNIENVTTQLKEAKKILKDESFWNEDGTFNFEAEGATEAMEVVSTLQAKLDYLSNQKYGIGLTVEDDKYEDALESLQNYGSTVASLNQLKLNPKANTEDIKKLESDLNTYAQELNNLPDDVKVDIGLVGEDGKTPLDNIDDIKEKAENGEISIPTTLDIQAKMGEDIEDLKKIALLNSGLLTDEEEEALKIDIMADVNIETGEVNDNGVKEDAESAVENSEEEPIDLDLPVNPNLIIEGQPEVPSLLSGNIIEAHENAQEDGKLVFGVGIKVEADEVDTSDVDDKTDKAITGKSGKKTSKKVEKKTDIEVKSDKVDTSDVDKKTDEAVNKSGTSKKKIDIELSPDPSKLLDYTSEEMEVITKFKADYTEVEEYSPEEKLAIAKYLADTKQVEEYSPEEKEAIAKFKKNSAEVDNYYPKDKEAIAKYLRNSAEVDSYMPPPKIQDVTANLDSSTVDNYKPEDRKFTVKAVLQKVGDWANKLLSGGSTRRVVNGTANVDGTAFIGGTIGRAFKHGDWSTKDSGTALVGELGAETLVRNGRYYTIGDTGAEFIDYEKGDIIFNHKQTEELFRYGKVTSGGGRGRALVGGTTFAEGTAFTNGTGAKNPWKNNVTVKADTVKVESKSTTTKDKSNKTATTKTKTTKSTKDTSDDFEETFDWIEIAIKRLERTIDRLDQKASRTWKSWSYRNKNLKDEISKINDEINLQEKAYNKYIAKANSVGLSSDWKKKVQNGQVNIQDIKDENLAEKIKEYQEWYEKALECKDALLELKDAEMEAYKQIFDNVVSKYDGIIAQIEHRMSMMDAFIERQETDGHIVSTAYYAQLIAQEENNIAELEVKRAELIQERANWVAAGGEVGSEEWNEMTEEINATTLAIEEGETAIIEYNNAIRQIEWDTFDLLQDKISNITKEAEFLIELMSNDDLYDDNGQLTAQGMATMGLHAQNYNVNMAQADNYGAEIAEIDEALAEDPYDQELLARRQELVEKQQEAILAAEAEKEAIRDMVEEGIEVELDALQERIDKYEEALDAQKDLYDYQKKVKEQTKEIADLEKQIAAYAGDDSEEARAKLQELKISLEDAKEELKETEYEKYISDQKALLDSLYDEYETILNSRLDNIDVLIEDMIGYVNENSDTINQTIHDEADAVGYDLSEETENIWGSNGLAGQVIGQYGDDFTAIKTVLNDIKIFVAKMVAASGAEANANISEENATNTENTTNTSNGSGSSGNNSNNNRNNNNNNKVIKTGGKINAKNAKIYGYKGDKTGARQYYRNDPIYKVLKMDGNWLQVRYHKLTKGVTGWFKKGDVKAYKTGVKDILDNQIAWTQENGKREFIVRPSDGAILTPLARGDSVLNANASGNIWDMANNPAEFIKNNLDLGIGSVPNMINTQNSYIQNLDNVTFNLPNVQNYNELLSAMQKDKNFEKLILSMSIDRVAGRSSLAKGKAIR